MRCAEVICLERERCGERAVEMGQGSLYHHPEAEEGGGLYRGTQGRSGWGRKISSAQALYLKCL